MRTDFKGVASKQNLLGEEKVFAQLRGMRGSPCHPGKNSNQKCNHAVGKHHPRQITAQRGFLREAQVKQRFRNEPLDR